MKLDKYFAFDIAYFKSEKQSLRLSEHMAFGKNNRTTLISNDCNSKFS